MSDVIGLFQLVVGAATLIVTIIGQIRENPPEGRFSPNNKERE